MTAEAGAGLPAPPEMWLRGPLPGVPALLQPVAHALLQAREEVERLMTDFPDNRLWTRPAGVASVGFHLQHLAGVLDRLFTYARGNPLNASQIDDLEREATELAPDVSGAMLVARFHRQVDESIAALRLIEEHTLTQPRTVGRNKLPSTVLGLLVHAAEHAQRHVGQLLVTVRIQRESC
jgi:uncharacterized damage-inducible protein DinB